MQSSNGFRICRPRFQRNRISTRIPCFKTSHQHTPSTRRCYSSRPQPFNPMPGFNSSKTSPLTLHNWSASTPCSLPKRIQLISPSMPGFLKRYQVETPLFRLRPTAISSASQPTSNHSTAPSVLHHPSPTQHHPTSMQRSGSPRPSILSIRPGRRVTRCLAVATPKRKRGSCL